MHIMRGWVQVPVHSREYQEHINPVANYLYGYCWFPLMCGLVDLLLLFTISLAHTKVTACAHTCVVLGSPSLSFSLCLTMFVSRKESVQNTRHVAEQHATFSKECLQLWQASVLSPTVIYNFDDSQYKDLSASGLNTLIPTGSPEFTPSCKVRIDQTLFNGCYACMP